MAAEDIPRDGEEQGVDKPIAVVDLESKSKSGDAPVRRMDPLVGIPANFRSQIPEEIARRARQSSGKFYLNVVRTNRSSSGSSSFSPRHPKAIFFPIAQRDEGAEHEEYRQIPDTPHYSARERATICRSVYKVVPEDYVASLPGQI